jgi:hypothetical protein
MQTAIRRLGTWAMLAAVALLGTECSTDSSPTAPNHSSTTPSINPSSTPNNTATVVGVSPKSVALATGDSASIKVTLMDRAGQQVPGTIVWSSSNLAVAKVSGTGVVTGIAAGAATITATSGSVSGTSQVAVTAVLHASAYHEPGGMAVQVNTGPITSLSVFDHFSPSTRSATGEWAGNLTLVPSGEGTGVRVHYPTYLKGANSPVRFGHGVPSPGTGWYYQRMKIRFSTNWTMSGNGSVKLCEPRTWYHGSGAGATENDVIAAHVYESTSAGAYLYVMLQGPEEHFENLKEQPLYNSTADLTGGAWHTVEVLFTPESTPGAKNGTYTGWVDGVEIAHWTGVWWLARGNKPGWHYLMVDPTYGGGPHSPAHDMYWDLDELYIATR